jgi:hypothetical protein
VGNKAQDAVRNARLATHKKIQAAKKGIRPDDFKKADRKIAARKVDSYNS